MDRRAFSTLALGLAAAALAVSLCPGALLGPAAPSSGLLFYVPVRERVIALTVDDGPSQRYTPQVLDTLARDGARATFFVVGQAAEAAPDLIAREVAMGNEVEDHTWSHPRMDRLDAAATASEIGRGADAVQRLTGVRPLYFRPPRGAYTAAGLALAASEGMRTVMWSVAVEHELRADPAEMSRYVLDRVAPGSIILVHDGRGDRSRSVAALDIILRGLRDRGYRVVTLSELLRAAR